MKLILGAVLVSFAVGYLIGGRLSGFASLRIRWGLLAIVGLALQLVPVSSGNWPFVLLMVSYVLLFVFAAVNVRSPGFPLILAGVVLNALVVGINHGMPVTRSALIASGQQDTLGALLRGGGAKHHLAGPGDMALFLGDVIPIPWVSQVLSVGDLFTYAGVAWLIVGGMRRGRRDAAGSPDVTGPDSDTAESAEQSTHRTQA